MGNKSQNTKSYKKEQEAEILLNHYFKCKWIKYSNQKAETGGMDGKHFCSASCRQITLAPSTWVKTKTFLKKCKIQLKESCNNIQKLVIICRMLELKGRYLVQWPVLICRGTRKNKLRAEMQSVVEHLPGMCKAVELIPHWKKVSN